MEERKVWNSVYLKNNIFSFLRKEPKKVCYFCKCVLIWDKEIKNHLYIPNIDNQYGFSTYYSNKISCWNCWIDFLENIYSFNFI